MSNTSIPSAEENEKKKVRCIACGKGPTPKGKLPSPCPKLRQHVYEEVPK